MKNKIIYFIVNIQKIIFGFLLSNCQYRITERQKFFSSQIKTNHVTSRIVLSQSSSTKETKDNRPHEQRRNEPRPARRLNHSFQHLHRHSNKNRYDDNHINNNSTISPIEYLVQHGGYDVTRLQSSEFPPLLSLSVQRHLQPKMRFLKYTLLNYTKPTKSLGTKYVIPLRYFGVRLETVFAPRHAFLMYHGLYHGRDLLEKDAEKLQLFLKTQTSSSLFAHLCRVWHNEIYSTSKIFTSSEIDTFETIFKRGLLSCVRNDVSLDKVKVSTLKEMSDLVPLLIHHGANVYERDTRGISLLHWACGCSHSIETVKHLCEFIDIDIKADRDGATPLHWAVVGVTSKQFGIGGDLSLTKYLLEQLKADGNALTKDGNSVIMWACWAASFDIVTFLLEKNFCTNLHDVNRNGCTLAHWAASGGDLKVCRYLHDEWNIDFDVENYAGNTPLCHAVAYGREEVVDWLIKNNLCTEKSKEAKKLAKDFVTWSDGDLGRKNIFSLF